MSLIERGYSMISERKDKRYRRVRRRTQIPAHRKYAAEVHRVATAHLEVLSCCATMTDAIRHITRSGRVPTVWKKP